MIREKIKTWLFAYCLGMLTTTSLVFVVYQLWRVSDNPIIRGQRLTYWIEIAGKRGDKTLRQEAIKVLEEVALGNDPALARKATFRLVELEAWRAVPGLFRMLEASHPWPSGDYNPPESYLIDDIDLPTPATALIPMLFKKLQYRESSFQERERVVRGTAVKMLVNLAMQAEERIGVLQQIERDVVPVLQNLEKEAEDVHMRKMAAWALHEIKSTVSLMQ